ncbi:MAG: cupin domain-containing protein [Vicinamibacterales bacterium]
MPPHAALYRWDELPLEKVTEMVARKTILSTGMQLTQAYFKKGAIVPRHQHNSGIIVYVLQGAIRFRLGTEETTVREGEVVVIPARILHHCESLDDSFVLSVVSDPDPMRDAPTA